MKCEARLVDAKCPTPLVKCSWRNPGNGRCLNPRVLSRAVKAAKAAADAR